MNRHGDTELRVPSPLHPQEEVDDERRETNVSEVSSLASCQRGLGQQPSAFRIPRKPVPYTVVQAADTEDAESAEIRRRGSNKRYTLLHEWWKELLGWLFGTAFVAAIVILLGEFDQKNLSHWHSRITINTVVSVLSQAAVSALMLSVSACIGQLKWRWYKRDRTLSYLEQFDGASRGPIGSLLMLVRYRPGLELVCLGSLITICVIGLPPFVQQAVSTTRIRSEIYSGSGQIKRLVTLNDTEFRDPSAAVGFGESQLNNELLNVDSREAIYVGMTDNTTSASDVTGNCPTSNCTFSQYTTLSICPTVVDVTSQITRNCTPKTDNVGHPSCTYNLALIDEFFDTNNGSSTVWWAPAYKGQQSFSESGNLGDPVLWVSSYPGSITGEPGSSNPSNDSADGVVLDVYVMYISNLMSYVSCWNTTTTCDKHAVGALHGSLQMCLNTYETTMVNGTTNTVLLSSNKDLSWKGPIWGYGLNGTWQTQLGQEEGLYTVDWSTVAALAVYLMQETFTGSLVFSSDGVTATSDAANTLGTDIWGDLYNISSPGYALTGFQNRLNNISLAITNSMRKLKQPLSNSTVMGQAWERVPFISVDHNWLIGPLLLWLLITIFVAVTIWLSDSRATPLWKSSPLALVESQHTDGATASSSILSAERGKVMVRVARNGEGWSFGHVGAGSAIKA